MKKIVVDVKKLNVAFPSFKQKKEVVKIVHQVDFRVLENEIIGFIGESGSGKSVTAKTLLGINNNARTHAEKIEVAGQNLLDKNNKLIRKKSSWFKVRGKKIAYIPQDSLTSLNPTMKIGKQIIEALKIHSKEFIDSLRLEHKLELSKLENQDAEKNQKKIKLLNNKIKNTYKYYAADILEKFGIKGALSQLKLYPHQFSGGMRQRAVIAMMVACQPDVIIADEPTTALDPTIQSSVLALFQKIVKETNVSIIFISHDIAVIAKLCDYIHIFYAGRIVEKGTKKDIFTDPRHPYTWSLLSAIPDKEINPKGEKLFTIPGQPPSFEKLPKGDPFSIRNPFAMKIDFKEEPPLFKVSNTHYAATWLLHHQANKVELPKPIQKLIKITKKDF